MIDQGTFIKGLKDGIDILYDAVTDYVTEEGSIPPLILRLPITKIAFKLDTDFRFVINTNFDIHLKIPRLGIDITIDNWLRDIVIPIAFPNLSVLLTVQDKVINGSSGWNYYIDGVYGIGTSFDPVQESTWGELAADIVIAIVGAIILYAIVKLGLPKLAVKYVEKLSNVSTTVNRFKTSETLDSIYDGVTTLEGETGTDLSGVGKTISGVLKVMNTAMQLDGSSDAFDDLEELIKAVTYKPYYRSGA